MPPLGHFSLIRFGRLGVFLIRNWRDSVEVQPDRIAENARFGKVSIKLPLAHRRMPLKLVPDIP